ncbi:hypothetical protein CBG57_00055 [Prevotella nigrescens]|nr:hypothetical protein CBG57_00055 [Prevotella nigrescens]
MIVAFSYHFFYTAETENDKLQILPTTFLKSCYCCSPILKTQQYFLSYKQEKGGKCVNIYYRRNYHVTTLLSTFCKTYCFALPKPPFWLPKTLVLHAKTGSFAMRNSSFYKALITMLLCEYLFL